MTKNLKQNNLSNNVKPLALSSSMSLALLIFQLLNLLTLVTQFHWLYLLFAILALTAQFFVHFKAIRKMTSVSQANQTVNGYSVAKTLPSWFVLLLAISGSVGIAIAGTTLGLLLSMIHLLCFAYSLKMFEVSSRKDLYQLVVLGVFVATSSLIFIQSIYFSLAVMVLIFSNFLILLNLFAGKMSLLTQSKLLAKLSLYAVPLAVILFVGFPKLSPLWQVPNVKSAKVGLSDSVKIGDIAQLTLSDELAFRVSFEGNTPQHAQLYWRAMVLDDFDGVTWRQASHDLDLRRRDSATIQSALSSTRVELRGESISYQVITEPSFQSWLFALDFATSEQGNIGQRSDFSLFYRSIISQTLSYQVTSYPQALLTAKLTEQERALNVALTTDNNPRLLAKARQLRTLYRDDRQLINQVLSEFNQQDYYYTLQPPSLSGNSLDQFYFDTRAGFCEHYASTFTYLMRAAGIPARMVVGYLGGEMNPQGNYLSVYQRNAHAWAEVWLPDSGWQRVDPTAAVDPERVERGFSNNLMQEYADLSSGLFSAQSLRAMRWYKQLKMQIEAIDYQWTRWVIGYTGQKQSLVLEQLLAGLKKAKNIFYLLLCLGAIILLISWYKATRVKVKNQHEIKQLYLNTLQLMANHDLVKERAMTGQQFAKFIAITRPELLENFAVISDYFEQFSYQNIDNHLSKQALNNDMKKLKYHYRHLRWQLWLIKLGIK